MIDCPPDSDPTHGDFAGDFERRRGNENRGGDLGTGCSGIGDNALKLIRFGASVGVVACVGVGVGAGAGKSKTENGEENDETLVIGVGVGVGGMEWLDVAMIDVTNLDCPGECFLTRNRTKVTSESVLPKEFLYGNV
jgi:hypothetical protein